MSEDEIKNNPSLRKLREDGSTFRNFLKIWPLLKPLAKILKVDTQSIDESLLKAVNLAEQVDEMTTIPDKFNDMFSEIGWILFDSMELEVAKEAITIAEKDGIENADEFLADHFSPDWVETRINWLKYINGFQSRFEMAKKALNDYKSGRFYSSTLVTLTLIDGWVSELNIIDFHRYGFFSEKSNFVAWDSIAAHPKGLMELKKLFSKSRLMTRTGVITIPYRHGIMHGMDLGYDNKFIAAKSWATLFALRDWVIKLEKGEITPPELEPEIEKSIWESIESYQRIREETERFQQWQPRRLIVGDTVPRAGERDEFPSNTPERKMVEFLNYWLKNNYGNMSECYAPMLRMNPSEVRESFQQKNLINYELIEIYDVLPFNTYIQVKVKLKNGEEMIDRKNHPLFGRNGG